MLEVPFLFRVTAEDVRSDKPEQPHFDAAVRGATQHGISKSEILHVAQSKHHDIFPGNRFGLTTVWVNRRDGKMGTGATLAATANPALTVKFPIYTNRRKARCCHSLQHRSVSPFETAALYSQAGANIALLAKASPNYLDTTHFDTVRFPPPPWAAEAFARAAKDTGHRGNGGVLTGHRR
jgi:hypothetical protein